MENIKDLIGLLMYQVQMLYCTEEQLLKHIPLIIEKAKHSSLKNALSHHNESTKEHKARLEKIPGLINERLGMTSDKIAIEPVKTDLSAGAECKGIKGLIEEAQELLNAGVNEDVTDAAIIGAVQKMEHYEICTYGTALAYANQLHLRNVELLLKETLDEEYDADDLLTALATASLNKEAEPEGIDALNKAANLSVNEEHGEADADIEDSDAGKVSISERTVNSPGGRAGTSHRRYPSGESRGH